MDKLYLHNGLNKEEKMVAYVLAWLLLTRRFLRDRMTTKDVLLLNAIKTRILTNWVAVLKDHMIDVGVNHGHNLTYGVFINKVLVLQGVDVSKEGIILCNKSHEISKAILTCIGLKKTLDSWCFRDEQTFVTNLANPPISDEDHFTFIPQTDFEKYVVERFKKTSERIQRVEKSLFRLEKKVDVLNQKHTIRDFTIDDSYDESTDEDSMDMSELEQECFVSLIKCNPGC